MNIPTLRELLEYSHEQKATDLHLCAGSQPLIRINGKLTHIDETGKITPARMNSLLDEMLDDQNKEALQSRKVLDFSFSISGLGRFRANIYSQRGVFAAAIRVLSYSIPPFSTLGLPQAVETFAAKASGLILATGIAGSGKSTTLASLLNLINQTYPYHIVTIEDPIEYIHQHKKSLVTQREIGGDAEGFASALRSTLRQDADVIMIGEMHDTETISLALAAAEAGHLVMSTLHTIGTAKSIGRIIGAFPPSQQGQVRSQLATVLEGIVSQQLIPRIDHPGLIPACEVMCVNPAIRDLIQEGKHYQVNNIMQAETSHFMQLMDADLARLSNKGIIAEEDALLRAQDQQLLRRFLDRR